MCLEWSERHGYNYDESNEYNQLSNVDTQKPSEQGDPNILLNEQEQPEPSLVKGVLSGFISCLIGAVLWALISVSTGYQHGLMALGVGLIVGVSIRLFGKGNSAVFGIFGAVFALLGCVLGNIFTMFTFYSRELAIPLLEIFTEADLPFTIELLKLSFNPKDIIFYALALYEGYRFSVGKK